MITKYAKYKTKSKKYYACRTSGTVFVLAFSSIKQLLISSLELLEKLKRKYEKLILLYDDTCRYKKIIQNIV